MRTASETTIEQLKADPALRNIYLQDAIEEVETGNKAVALLMLRQIAKSLAALLLLFAVPAYAFPAIVLGCHDGDTCQVYAAQHVTNCRLAGIDAPELHNRDWPDQPYGYEAQAILHDLIMGQAVDVELTGQRSSRREVCRLTYRGQDLQEMMVRDGAAWSAIQYEPVKDRDIALPRLEAEARSARRGLWADPGAVAPWDGGTARPDSLFLLCSRHGRQGSQSSAKAPQRAGHTARLDQAGDLQQLRP